jgi:hypothetical protein
MDAYIHEEGDAVPWGFVVIANAFTFYLVLGLGLGIYAVQSRQSGKGDRQDMGREGNGGF